MTTRRVLGAVLVLVAAALAATASFLSAYSVEATIRGRTFRFETTAWTVNQDDFQGALQLGPIEFGEPAIGGAILMALAAVLAWRHPAARVGSLLGAGVLAGAAWSAVGTVQGTVKQIAEVEAPVQVNVAQGDGVTLLIIAAGVAVVAAVLHQELPRRVQNEPDEAAGGAVIHQIEGDDTETPPYGYPVIVEPKSD